MGRSKKEFSEYLTDAGPSQVTHGQYLESPATAFLAYAVEAKDAVNLCMQRFNKGADGKYNRAALDSLEHINSAMLPAIMGHFETFQRHLFAGVFDFSANFSNFDVSEFFKRLEKVVSFSFSPLSLAAHRGLGANSIGLLLADNLHGWHDPNKVNSFLRCFGFKVNAFSGDDCDRLRVLWQLRHSIVHTGGTLTLPDAQKTGELQDFGGKNLAFEKNFTLEVARKMHPLVRDATFRIRDAVQERLYVDLEDHELEPITRFFDVRSKVSVWLK